jgi:hypothetical protein
MTTFEIPLSNVPQTFQIALGGVDYLLTCKWNDAADAGWVLDFADALTDTPIAANIPLITGVDLLSGLEYLGINGELYVFTDGNDLAIPTLENLGSESKLYFKTDVANG